MENWKLLNSLILLLILFMNIASSQKCVAAPKDMDITERAYKSPVVIKAKILTTSSPNYTAQVTEVFPTRKGGLSVKSEIKFGPIKKSKSCRIKKDVVLFLEEADESDPQFFKIKYDPLSKMKSLKKLKKSVLCSGCVKPPQFKKPRTAFDMRENQKMQLDCKVTGSPKPKVIFIKDGKVLPKKVSGMKISIKRRGGGGRIKIKKLKKQHAGVYICQATNLAGSLNLTYTVAVKKDDCIPCAAEWKDYCMHGRCCMVPVLNHTSCRCEERYTGERCQSKVVPPLPRKDINVIEARYHQQTIAIMSVCIALLLVIFICYVVYVRFKKSRSKIRKEILNGHIVRGPSHSGVTTGIMPEARGEGILGDDRASHDIAMTGYRSTDLNEPPQQPIAFAQRPQTYDEVILSQGEGQPLIKAQTSFRPKHEENIEDLRQRNGAEVQLQRVESNGKRNRLKGVAIGQSELQQASTSAKPKQVEKIKTGPNSLSSSMSSIGSHDLKKPAIPIDEKLAHHLAQQRVRIPPSYPDHAEDVRDSAGMIQESHQDPVTEETPLQQPQSEVKLSPQMSPHSQKFFPTPHSNAAGREREPSSVSSGSVGGSTHRVTTFDTDGRIQEEMLGREDNELQGVTPHSPNLSPQNSHPRSTRNEVYIPHEIRPQYPLSSPGHESLEGGPKMGQPGSPMYPRQNEPGRVYPYYEHNQEHPASPASSHRGNETDDIFSGMEIPDTSLHLYSPNSPQQRMHSKFDHPSSPRQYQTSPEMSVGVPYRYAPASARHQHLPLLTREIAPHEQSPLGPDNRLVAGSTVSLSSSSNASSSHESERHRDSHKIEV